MTNIQPKSWIDAVLAEKSNSFLLEIPRSFLREGFNMTNLHDKFADSKGTLNKILSYSTFYENQEQTDAMRMYIMLHQRYLLTPDGLKQINNEIRKKRYGVCKREQCNKNPLIPTGHSDNYSTKRVKLFCYKCYSFYRAPKDCKISSTAFGANFCELYRLCFHLKPRYDKICNFKYKPTLFGMEVDYSYYDDEKTPKSIF
ncbi:hypothetical protein EDEG_02632 [Edhazardia aedis USNM 41457]|uniref:Casein kinase II subunit beta n=1 Tax=Edhazardia aedis (strain USNM 41457) TaxID=1003232 RepID=J8ZTI0_EDHAE|nr:hypothetical protein EDEG_02632 [Edhazardia aedis USNM 41457]|eukprot:EJW02988.1 hypothetical protein EDEG_02632 [Edhazardia aedis USNM 41457]